MTPRHHCFILALSVVTSLLGAPQTARADDGFQSRLRLAQALGIGGPVAVRGATLRVPDSVRRFYVSRAYAPVWTRKNLPVSDARSVHATLVDAASHGLDPAAYHADALTRLLKPQHAGADRVSDARALELELLLTDAFLLYGSHLLHGRINPRRLGPTWDAAPREADLVQSLADAVATQTTGLTLERLAPRAPEYERLRRALRRYRLLTWSPLPPGAVGPSSPESTLTELRARLAVEGFGYRGGRGYDASLSQAVQQFQRSRGLQETGHVGPRTRRALDLSSSDIATQLALNMERWRWLPRNLGERYISVNVPAFELVVRRKDADDTTMRVIVGKPERPTPVFSTRVTHVVFHPVWNVPRRIAIEDKLPRIQKDVGYLTRNHLSVLDRHGAAKQIDPRTIDWKSVPGKTFPYRLRQAAGPLNALGVMKLEMPNHHQVYVHHTPDRALFSQRERAHSAGCIRAESPETLAAAVLDWTAAQTQQAVAAGKTTWARATSMPVHLVYFTAWADEAGTVQLRPDIYGHDAPLARALTEPAPAR